MKRSVSWIAVAFWIVGAVFLIGDVPIALSIRDFASHATFDGGAHVAHAVTLMNVWSETRSAFLYGGQLIGIGVLIELVDQIRWNGLHRPLP
jgi:hypothetical protein